MAGNGDRDIVAGTGRCPARHRAMGHAGSRPVGSPPSQQANAASRAQVCMRLESQLAAIDRGGNLDPATAEQIKRYEDAAGKQQAELDRLGQQSRAWAAMAADFSRSSADSRRNAAHSTTRSSRCAGSLDRYLTEIQRLQGNSGEREGQRRGILVALGQNDCGPQYRQYATSGPGGFFENLFGGNLGNAGAPADLSLGRNLPHIVRAKLRRLLLPDFLLHGAGQVRRRRAALSAPLPGRRGDALHPSQPRRRRFARGVDRAADHIRSCRTRSATESNSMPPAAAGHRASPGPRRCAKATTRRSNAATSSSPKSVRGNCRSRASTPRASRSASIRMPAARLPPPRGMQMRMQAQRQRRRERCSAAARRCRKIRPAAGEQKAEEDPSKRKVRAVGPSFYPVDEDTRDAVCCCITGIASRRCARSCRAYATGRTKRSLCDRSSTQSPKWRRHRDQSFPVACNARGTGGPGGR